jgi:hypothetical protein
MNQLKHDQLFSNLDQKTIILTYLQYLSKKIEIGEIDENILQKIYNIFALDMANCNLESDENKKVLDYTFLGWYLSHSLEENQI